MTEKLWEEAPALNPSELSDGLSISKVNSQQTTTSNPLERLSEVSRVFPASNIHQ